MLNKIVNAITKQLHTKFGDSYHYYKEDVEQNFKKPAFCVQFIQPLQRSRNRLVYDRTMPMVIYYYSNDKAKLKEDAYTTAEKVMEALEYLPFENGLIRGEDMNWLLVDDVLEIFVTYKFQTRKTKEIDFGIDLDSSLDFEGYMEEIESFKVDSV